RGPERWILVDAVQVRETLRAQTSQQVAGAAADLEDAIALPRQERPKLLHEELCLNGLQRRDGASHHRGVVAREVGSIVRGVAVAEHVRRGNRILPDQLAGSASDERR